MKRFYLSLVILIILSQACSFIQGETAPAASQPSAPPEPIFPAATEVQATSEISPPADQPEVQQEGQQAGLQVYLPVDQSTYYNGIPDECWNDPATRKSQLLEDNGFSVFPALQDGAASGPLYFTMVIHIEPQEEYANPERYELDKERLTRMADLVAAHGGRLTIETQRPFITTSQKQGDDILRTWERQGHEIAVHFHENNYVKGKPGSFGSDVPFEEWVAALGGLKDEISGLVDKPVVTWSGGNLYPRIAEVAQAVGLSVNTNYKDPTNQSIDSAYMTVSPWRLTDGKTSTERAIHNPNGTVIYLPSGVYPAHCGNAEVTPHPYTTSAFDYVTKALVSSLKASRPGYINSFYLTIHPGDFGIPKDDEAEFTRWSEWLTKVIDPLVADGRLRWSTASQTAAAFIVWEKEHSAQLIGQPPPQTNAPSTAPAISSSSGNQQPQFNPFKDMTSEQEACLRQSWDEAAFTAVTTFQRPPSPEEEQTLFTCLGLPPRPSGAAQGGQLGQGFPGGQMPGQGQSPKDPQGPYYHQVMLASSPDGSNWVVNDAVVRNHASVPEIAMLGDGSRFIYYVDGTVDNLDALRQVEDGSWQDVDFTLLDPPTAKAVDPDVVSLPDGRLRLFYFGANQPIGIAQGKHMIYSAISSDGVTFLSESGSRIEVENITDPSVVVLPDGTWLMALSRGAETLLAASQDGNSFTLTGITLSQGGVPELTMLPDNRLRLYVCGKGGILSSTSSDNGATWTQENGVRIPAHGNISCDPSVIHLNDGSWLMAWKRFDPAFGPKPGNTQP